MNSIDLTMERQNELATLLDNPHRLKCDYPKVAEYLDTAPNLTGTGNTANDADFDLRFIHYMTGGRTESSNPYWDIVAKVVSLRDDRRIADGGSLKGSSRLAFAQMILQQTYAYAIPSPETIRWIAEFTGEKTILDIGAGRGYWSDQLRNFGLVTKAHDLQPPNENDNPSFPKLGTQAQTWHQVDSITSLRYSGKDILFLCWPPGWNDTMASEALTAFERSGGTQLIYIGEPKGGKTANDDFFTALSARWKLVSVDPNYVAWWNLDDQAQAWIRKI